MYLLTLKKKPKTTCLLIWTYISIIKRRQLCVLFAIKSIEKILAMKKNKK